MAEFESQEQLDDAFEYQMELLQEQQRLRECIQIQEDEVENLKGELGSAQEELYSLQDELDEVDSKIL